MIKVNDINNLNKFSYNILDKKFKNTKNNNK